MIQIDLPSLQSIDLGVGSLSGNNDGDTLLSMRSNKDLSTIALSFRSSKPHIHCCRRGKL